MMHFAQFLIDGDKNGNTEVVVYCPNEIIANQAKEKLCMFECAAKVLVTHNWEPLEWLERPELVYFLIDEGEDVIEKNLLDLTLQGFQGLAALKDKRTVLYTATLTDYNRACWRRAFKMPEEAVHKFPSQQEVRNDKVFK